jgi:hypothetical protein
MNEHIPCCSSNGEQAQLVARSEALLRGDGADASNDHGLEEALMAEELRVQVTFREHQGTFREHSGNVQGTFREH